MNKYLSSYIKISKIQGITRITAKFARGGIQNFRNQHQWADGHMRFFQQQFFINIWAVICGGNLFGSHVLPNRLTGLSYKAFLGNNTPDFLADVPVICRRELQFK
jgi:hypothetical protein